MRIGELAKRTGASASKIRFYEDNGLVPRAARLTNGYRDYDDYALEVLLFIRRAQSLGFTLRDIATHLRTPDDGGRKTRLRARLEARMADLDVQLEQLNGRRRLIASLIEELRVSQTG